MNKAVILTLSLMIAAGATVSCSKSAESSSENTLTGSSAPTGAAAIDALKDIAGESLKEQLKEVPTLQSDLLPDDAKESINSCIVSMYCSDAEETLKYFYPNDIYNAIINSDKKDNFAAEGSPDNRIADFRIDNVVKLSADTGLSSAEKYFDMTSVSVGIDDCRTSVSSGYAVGISFDVSSNGTTESVSQGVVLVNISDEGWKVIPLNVNQLKKAVS